MSAASLSSASSPRAFSSLDDDFATCSQLLRRAGGNFPFKLTDDYGEQPPNCRTGMSDNFRQHLVGTASTMLRAYFRQIISRSVARSTSSRS